MNTPALDKPTPTQIRDAIVANLIAKEKYYPSRLSGMAVIDQGDSKLIDSNEAPSTFNIVCVSRLQESQRNY